MQTITQSKQIKSRHREITFLAIGAVGGGAGGAGGVVGEVAVGVGVRRRVVGGRVRVGRAGGRGRRVVVRRREVAHAGALLDDGAVRQPHAEQPHSAASASAAAAGRARAGVVPVVAAVRAPPSHRAR